MASAVVCNTFSGTGDIQNNLAKLLREVDRMKLQAELSVRSLTIGLPSAFLPILHAAFMTYSLPLAKYLVDNGIELYGKSDFRFLDLLFRALRELFHYYPKLTREQFLSAGYSERKLILTTDILRLCQAKHRELSSEREGDEKTATGEGKGRKRGRSRGRRRQMTRATQSTPVADNQMSVQQAPSVCSIAKDIHLPLSPPPSPRHATPPPAVIRGPEFILPDADLAATPTRTAASPTSLTSSNSTCSLCAHPDLGQADTGPNKEGLASQCIGQQPFPKEHTGKKEAVTRMCMGGGLPEREGKGSSQGRNSVQTSENSNPSDPSDEHAFLPLMHEICNQLDQVRQMVEKMAVRVAVLEVQVKKLEGSSSVQLAESKCNTTKNGFVDSSGVSPSHLYQVHTPGSTKAHSNTTQSPLTNSSPPLVASTPDDTRSVIDNLRSRARKARELLDKANSTSVD